VGKVNVYLPDDLEQAVRDAGIPVSSVCQVALRAAVDRLDEVRTADDPVAAMPPMTPRLAEVLADLRASGSGSGPATATVYDLLGAIVAHGENLGARVLRDLGVELPKRILGRRGRRTVSLDEAARAALIGAVRIALELRHERVGTEHVVLALSAADSPVAGMFAGLGLDERAIRTRIERLVANPWRTDALEPGAPPAAPPAVLDRFEAELQRLSHELKELRRRG
jgi:ATP-dependent Clp protease ATP-binding subunit ClpC